jgi:mono/diheme cytochrome c family protein
MHHSAVFAFAALVALTVTGCGEPVREAERRDAGTGRWYSVQQVVQGGPVFAEHCAACHGARAEGAEEWFRRLPDGRWPPPPLNGTAHAWHHPLWQLRQQIREGSNPEHGNMPGFAGVLSGAEIDAVIAWFQSFWPEEIYAAWLVYDANTPGP